jgi:PD-(D/E)XK nuclease superfamily
MQKVNFASYQLWSQFEPALGWEDTHCQMQRGWRWTQSATPRELQTSPVIETIWQKVGILAQQGVYEFHQNPLLLKHPRGVDRVADRLYLYYEVAPVRQRVMRILQQYQAEPWLVGKDILVLNRGDEPIPAPIEIQVAEDRFQLFAAFDCLVREADGQIHIIDFKTGQADFDRRQADVYLLAISYLYPDRAAVASFYNLETNTRSELITATPVQLAEIAHKLAEIAQLHQQQLQDYHAQPDSFDRLFPPHPGNHCRYCSFNYLCTYATSN